jgi:2-keto-4-pentenoate hydratase
MSSMENTHKPVLDWLEAQIFEDGPVGDVVDKIPDLDAGDAYRLRDALMKRRIAKGDRHIGYKVAGASRAIQTTEHVEGPMVGCLMHSGLYAEKVPIRIGGYKRVIVESEVAVLLKNDLPGPGVGITDVLLATAGLFPAIEVVARRGERVKRSHAMRIIGSKFTGGGIVIGAPMSAPHGIDLRLEGMVISINGEVKGSATGVEVMGNPLTAVALVANTIAGYGAKLEAGMLIMTGSFMGNLPVQPRDDLRVDFTRLGSVTARFVE